MLRTTKNMREKYEKIQSFLFTLIPEKWDAIYLYASVADKGKTGEMYFYYLPKSILKKKPVNVYEVPDKFNINEEQYLNIVKDLYEVIKELRQDFMDTEQDLWTSVTMSILNTRFKVEYNYDEIPDDEDEKNARRIIWRYKYLKIGGEKKEERVVLDKYFTHDINITKRNEIYETGVYLKTDNSNIMFDKEEVSTPKQVVMYEKEDSEIIQLGEAKEQNITEEIKNDSSKKEESKNGKNQILNT